MRKLLILAVAATPLALATPTFASDDDVTCPPLPAGEWLPMGDIESKLAGMGYQVRKLERERNCYEFEGTDAQGARVKGYVDPGNGQIVPRRERQRRS